MTAQYFRASFHRPPQDRTRLFSNNYLVGGSCGHKAGPLKVTSCGHKVLAQDLSDVAEDAHKRSTIMLPMVISPWTGFLSRTRPRKTAHKTAQSLSEQGVIF